MKAVLCLTKKRATNTDVLGDVVAPKFGGDTQEGRFCRSAWRASHYLIGRRTKYFRSILSMGMKKQRCNTDEYYPERPIDQPTITNRRMGGGGGGGRGHTSILY